MLLVKGLFGIKLLTNLDLLFFPTRDEDNNKVVQRCTSHF